MLNPGSTSWPDAVPVFIVAAALLFVPGTVAGLVMRMRVLGALAVGPLLSTTCVAVGGIVVALTGLRWSALSLTLCVLVLWGLAAGVRLTRGARAGSGRVGTASVGEPDGARRAVGRWRPVDPVLAATAIGLVVAFAICLVSVLPEARSPEAFPQQPDAIFHLAVPQWMNSTGSISSLTAQRFSSVDGRGFYPAAFHGFTATISMLTGASVVVSTSTFVLAVAGLVWPLGCIALALTLFGRRPVVALAAAVVSVLFTGYPYSLMTFGVIWPNLFGQALLPACLAALVAALGSTASPRYAVTDRAGGVVLVLASLPGLFLAHPNALISFGVLGGLLVLGHAISWTWARRGRPAVALPALAGILLVLVLVGAILVLVRPPLMYNTGVLGPEASPGAAALTAVLFAPASTMPLVVLSLLVLTGVVAILTRYAGARWVVTGLVVMVGLFWLDVAIDSRWTRYLTWPWYNNGLRLQAVAVLPAVIAAAAGVVWLRDLLVRFTPFRRAPRAVGPALVVLLLVATGAYVVPHQHLLHRTFHPKAADSWVTKAELEALQQLSRHLPADAVVAANPWKGGTYLYVVSGRRLLIPTEKSNDPGDRRLLAARLDEVGSDPAVCDAARRQHVGWALTGGQAFSGARSRVKQYVGIDAVGDSSAWQQVAHDGDYTLYKRVACAGQ